MNLRGAHVFIEVAHVWHRVTVITRLRDDVWQVEGDTLPTGYLRPDGERRISVRQSDMRAAIPTAAPVTRRFFGSGIDQVTAQIESDAREARRARFRAWQQRRRAQLDAEGRARRSKSPVVHTAADVRRSVYLPPRGSIAAQFFGTLR